MGTFSRRERAQQAENDENADENNADDTEVIALPLEYALLSSKEKKQYQMVLGAVTTAAQKLRVRDCTPKKIITDFEIGIVNAAEEEGSDETEVSCCFFHLGQSLYRRIQAEGLQEEYNDPEDS